MNYISSVAGNQLKNEELVPELPPIDKIPAALKKYDTWVAWDYNDLESGISRSPYSTELSFENAYQQCIDKGLHLGFKITPYDPFAAVIIKNACDENGKVSADAQKIIDIAKTYTQVDSHMREVFAISDVNNTWNVGKDDVSIVSNSVMVPILRLSATPFGTVQNHRDVEFHDIASSYCVNSWMARVDAIKDDGDEFSILDRVLNECLATPGVQQDAHKTELFEFMGRCFQHARLESRVISWLHSFYQYKGEAEVFLKACRECIPKKETSKDKTENDNNLSEDKTELDDVYSILQYNPKRTKILENFYNMTMILQNHEEWKDRLKFDTFQNNVIMDDKHPLSDPIEHRITEWFGKHFDFGGNSSIVVRKAIHAASTIHTYDPLYDFMTNLPAWDGKKRLYTWMVEMCGSPETPHSAWIGYMTIMEMVARAINPGCMARQVPVWEGPENKGKSRMISILGSPWSITFDMSMDSKEAHMAMQGTWVAELCELDTLRKTTETRLKSFVSQTQDTFVPKYSNNKVSYPRRSVFIGSTNDMDWMPSATGNTRWYPISTFRFNHDLMMLEREQLFAEAMDIFKHNPDIQWWEEPNSLRSEIDKSRDERRSFNAYEDDLNRWLDGDDPPGRTFYSKDPLNPVPVNRRITDTTKTTWTEIAEKFLGLDTPDKWKDKGLQMQVTSALKSLKWTRTKKSGVIVWMKEPDNK